MGPAFGRCFPPALEQLGLAAGTSTPGDSAGPWAAPGPSEITPSSQSRLKGVKESLVSLVIRMGSKA